MQEHPSTTRPDLAQMVAQMFGLNRHKPAEVIHMPERRAPQAMTATLVALPTQQDIDSPTTIEARASLAVVAHLLAAMRERWTGQPTRALDCYDDARALVTSYTRTYRRVATHDNSIALRDLVADATGASQKVD